MTKSIEFPEFESSTEILKALDEALVKFAKDLTTQRQMLEELKLMKEQNSVLEKDIEASKHTLYGLITENVRLREQAYVKEYSEQLDRDLGTIDSALVKGQKKS